jgi:V8-like Glu-specific endopeptidase
MRAAHLDTLAPLPRFNTSDHRGISRTPRGRLFAAALLVASACTDGGEADLTGDATGGTDVGGGISVRFDLGDAPDAAVAAEAQQLLPDLSQLAAPRTRGKRETIVVRYAGHDAPGTKRTGEPQPDAGQGPRATQELGSFSFLAFNPATRNRYEVTFPSAVLTRMHESAEETGLNREVRIDDDAAPSTTVFSWSGGVDNRARFYGVDQPVTAWERQRVSDFGGCTVTLIGPRHVITAGHCVYNRSATAGQDPWTDNTSIRVARNGTSQLGSVFIDNDNIPAGQVLWYWVPSSYISASSGSDVSEFDISLVVTPARIGETTGGWMGWWVLSQATLDTQSTWNVGYPACNAFTSDGTPRIDEPSPCSENHLYGDVGTCYPATFTNLDGDGWNRNFRHRCDASAGQSGSPIYLNYNGNGWGVTGVHTTSVCGAVAGDACSGSDLVRPLMATRITPEYSGVISYFRNLYP